MGYGKISYPSGDGRSIPKLAHRLAYWEATGEEPTKLDHKCLVTSCVNPKHLRPVTTKQNAENMPGTRSNNTSGFRGVGLHKRSGKYRGYVKHNLKYVHVGTFDTAEQANDAVLAKRLELFTHNELDRITT